MVARGRRQRGWVLEWGCSREAKCMRTIGELGQLVMVGIVLGAWPHYSCSNTIPCRGMDHRSYRYGGVRTIAVIAMAKVTRV